MAKVEVYFFRTWDHAPGENVTSKRAATLEAIEGGLGTAILDTRHEVDESDLDGNGMVRAPAECGGMASACLKCAELVFALERAERARVAAREHFEAHTTVAAAEAAANDYREAADALNRAIADLAVHRKVHEAPQG
jgi:uncharacterized membrane protein